VERPDESMGRGKDLKGAWQEERCYQGKSVEVHEYHDQIVSIYGICQ
jgi:hypothetical protein